MTAQRTISEALWPDTPEFNTVLKSLKSTGSTTLLSFIWSAYDRFYANVISKVDCSENDGDLERSITQLLEPIIREAMSGFEPFYVQHGTFEHETRMPAPAQPPQYDIAFVWKSHPRSVWPIEAKVLRTDRAVTSYVNEINDNFLTCRYAPFSSEGAMLGYLLNGVPRKAFAKIAIELGCKLNGHPDFQQRNHKTSSHFRLVPSGKSYPSDFLCHHMIFEINNVHEYS